MANQKTKFSELTDDQLNEIEVLAEEVEEYVDEIFEREDKENEDDLTTEDLKEEQSSDDVRPS